MNPLARPLLNDASNTNYPYVVEKVEYSSSNKRRVIGIFALAALFGIVLYLLLLYSNGGDDSSIPNESEVMVVTPHAGTFIGFLSLYTNLYDDSKQMTEIYKWRGIPYAVPPIGTLRWYPPKHLPPSSQTRDTKDFAEPCVQISQDDGNVIGSEDCLYLNIYTTATSEDDKHLLFPVLVYIYGGGMMNGAANASFDDLIAAAGGGKAGENDSNNGLVVVEVAYRLNAFGFLATHELSTEFNQTNNVYTSGNYGISDQILALQWVQENIKAFGGDPKRVTIAGQSSGGTSVFALLSVSKNITSSLFTGAISMSGSPNISLSLANAELQNASFNSNCNCSRDNNTEILECMRNLSAIDLVQCVPPSWGLNGVWNLPKSQHGQNYTGLVIVDGTVISSSFKNSLATGHGNIVPLMMGNMQCESDEGPELVVTNYTVNEWQLLLNTTFQPWTKTLSLDSRLNDDNYGDIIAHNMDILYSNQSHVNPQKAFDSIVSDYGLYCAQIQITKTALSQYHKTNNPNNIRNDNNNEFNVGNFNANIFLYEDNWSLSKAYISPWTDSIVKYPFHDLFYFMVTGQWNLIGDGKAKYTPTQSDLNASNLLQGLWMEFLRDSSQSKLKYSPSSNANVEYTWEPVNAQLAAFDYKDPVTDPYSNYSIFVISNTTVVGSEMKLNHKLDICQYYQEIGLDNPSFWWVN